MRVFKTEDLIERGKCIHIFSSHTDTAAVHTHDFIELIYVLSGEAIQWIDGRSLTASHGDLIFLNWGCTHAFEPVDTLSRDKRDFSYINICFSPETVGDAVITPENAFALLSLTAFDEMRNEARGGRISFFGNERREIEEILRAMQKEYREKSVGWHTVMESYLNILITRMLRKTELSLRADALDGVWRELSDFIDGNLQGELTLSALASKCFYNPSYFSRAFKEKFGMSAVEYVARRRLDTAMRLLEEGDLSVDEVGREAGFSDRSGFYYAFSKYVGGTPSEYRRKQAKK